MHPNALTLPSFASGQPKFADGPLDLLLVVPAANFLGVAPEDCAAATPGERTAGDLTLPNWLADPAGGFDPNGWFFFDSFSSQPARIAPNLDPTYADTWLVASSGNSRRRTSIGLTYIEKETSDIFEDTCNGNVPTPTAGADCDFYVMVNLPGLVRDYSGVILDFESRFADWIHVRSSYTYSESKGNVGYTQNQSAAYDIYPRPLPEPVRIHGRSPQAPGQDQRLTSTSRSTSLWGSSVSGLRHSSTRPPRCMSRLRTVSTTRNPGAAAKPTTTTAWISSSGGASTSVTASASS